jgi:hypothetical protein
MPLADAEQSGGGYLHMFAPRELVYELFVKVGVPGDGMIRKVHIPS